MMRKRTMWEADGDEHPYVEIAGIKWAKTNIGAKKETDYGLYFQYGDTQGYTASQVGTGDYQKPFGWEGYKFGNGTSSAVMVKYNYSDSKTALALSDDAARLYWGGCWRMPTTEEFVALGNATITEWVTNYNGSGINGILSTDKTDSSKKLFFPAAGFCSNNRVSSTGGLGDYWSSSLYRGNKSYAHCLNFTGNSIDWGDDSQRRYGQSVRPVLDDSELS